MANLDTKAKRKSSVSMLMPFMPPGITPGGVAQENRQAGAWSYPGILAGGVSVTLSIIDPTIESLTIKRTFSSSTVERDMLSTTSKRTIHQK